MNKAQVHFISILKVFAIVSIALIFSLLVLDIHSSVEAATGIRRTINFQGKLVNTNGTNVANGNYSIVFSIYDVSSDGTALWSETQGTVSVTDGVFQVELGSSTAFPADFNFNWDGRYLGVKVGADNEMTPRIRLTAVPYAFNAERVAGLTVQDTSGNASTSGILQIANAKTINLGTQNLTFTTSGDTTLTLPTSGTLATLAGSEIFTNKTIGSTGLTFSGATIDLTTGTDEDLRLDANGTGTLIISDSTITLSGFITDANSVLYANTSGALSKVTETETGSLCLLSGEGVSGAPSWGSCPGGVGGSSNWTLDTSNGVLRPNNNKVDLLIGGTATNSAIFAVTGLSAANNQTQASVSGRLVIMPNNGYGGIAVGGATSIGTSSDCLKGGANPAWGSCGGGTIFTDDTGFTYLTDTAEDFVLGASTVAAATFYVDVSEGMTYLGKNNTGSGGVNGGLTFYSSGNGIADPTIITDSSGNLTIQATQAGSSVIVGDGSGNITLEPGTDNIVANLASTGDFLIQDNGTTYVIFTDGGLVGIGTTSPTSALHVTKPLSTGATGKALAILDQIENQDILTASAGGTTKFVINNAGNVGIGTTAPLEKLDITGNATMSGNLTLNSAASIQTTNMQTLTVGGSTTGNISLKANNSGTGKVQIGTGNGGSTTPDLLGLDVKSDTGDPAGFEGAMYYNTQDNKFRCYQGSAWTDCISSGGGTSKFVVKGTNESLASNTNLQSDDELTFAVGASETWIFQYSLLVNNSNDAGPDWKTAILGASGWTCNFFMHGRQGTAVDPPITNGTDCDNAPTAVVDASILASTTTTPFHVYIQGKIVTSSSGNVVLQWAQNTSDTGALVVMAGSWVKAQKVGGSDLAEVYYSKDPLLPGTVVSLDSSIKAGVKKSSSQYDRDLLGIVSTKPGLVIGGDDHEDGVPALVALSGRVPVKVSTENGNIMPGDYLTSSSIPGVAMKASKAGTIIGQAMTDYSGADVGEVTAFVKTTFGQGEKADDIVKSGQSMEILEYLVKNNTYESVSEISTDRLTAGLEIITPKVIAQDIAVAGLLTADVIRANKIEGLEFSIRDQVLSMRDLFNSDPISSLESKEEKPGIINQARNLFEGVVEFIGQVIFRGDVSFEGQVAFNKDSAGYARIQKGQKFVEVVFEKEYVNQPVVNASIAISNLNEESFKKHIDEGFCEELEGIEVCQDKITDLILNGTIEYAVKNQTTKSFAIFLSDQAPLDITFSWQAIAVKDVKTVVGDGPAGLVLPFEGEYLPSNKFGEHSDDFRIKDKDLRLGLKGHDGLDIALPMETSVLAVDDGEVELDNDDYGTTIYIKHIWGKTVYGHLSKSLVGVGDKVTKGQKIALSGNSGLTTGPHLHFGIKLNNSKTDNGYNGFENPHHFVTFVEPVKSVAGVSDSSVEVSPTPSKTQEEPEPASIPEPVVESSNEVDLRGLEGLSLN